MASEQVTVEQLLKEYGNLGLRKLIRCTGLSKRSVKYQIYNSKFIENTSPYLHGSGKVKIRVFNYTPVESLYSKRKKPFQRQVITETTDGGGVLCE